MKRKQTKPLDGADKSKFLCHQRESQEKFLESAIPLRER